MRECCGNKEQSRIDWASIQKEKMPYRTVCGIRQHWENMQRRDKLQQRKVAREVGHSYDVDQSRRSLYESDENSESEEGDGTHYSDSEGDRGTEDERLREMPELTE